MRILGIDPGISGAIGLITVQARYCTVHDIPTMLANKTGNKQQVNVAELTNIVRTILLENPNLRAVMERVTPMPSQPGPGGERRGMGASSAFMFGKSVGHIEGVLAALGIPVEFVMPAQWKRAMGLSGDKEAARALAQQCFPEAPLGLKKHHGRAEALLVAKWYADRERRAHDPARNERLAQAEEAGEPF
jgi:crossover junction endodeoxyribonuclease RuvC